ncbi:hypothetical [Yersinia pestis KIM10+]|uniref:Uncharacterized protein n=1 Tax=Yersinia pestis TaxID=632 RepID=Q8CKP7_YERPE|nr:hypothetical [Yersinia pestis KIM10+]
MFSIPQVLYISLILYISLMLYISLILYIPLFSPLLLCALPPAPVLRYSRIRQV